jgi:hypothetical protein
LPGPFGKLIGADFTWCQYEDETYGLLIGNGHMEAVLRGNVWVAEIADNSHAIVRTLLQLPRSHYPAAWQCMALGNGGSRTGLDTAMSALHPFASHAHWQVMFLTPLLIQSHCHAREEQRGRVRLLRRGV